MKITRIIELQRNNDLSGAIDETKLTCFLDWKQRFRVLLLS